MMRWMSVVTSCLGEEGQVVWQALGWFLEGVVQQVVGFALEDATKAFEVAEIHAAELAGQRLRAVW